MRSKIFLLISLLIILVISTYSIKAINNFYEYKNAVDPKLELTLDRFHFLLKNELKSEWIKLTAPEPLKDEESPLKTFRITVDQKDINKLNADLPSSGKEQFVQAYMMVSDKKDKIYKIKLRYRGDSNYHWLYTQKSLRIKLGDNDVYEMAKEFNLINPPSQLSYRDSINYELSKELGLISPQNIPSRVYINGNYMGVYIYLNQIDESLLRAHRIMPGSIYSGDGSPIAKNGVADLWNKDIYWKKKAARNAEQKANREDIKLFINSIKNLDNKEFNNFVETYFDKEKFFTFIALDRLFGSHHHDYIHNHKLYFDPYKGKFEPISWDLRFWLPMEQKDLSIYPLQIKLSNNPIYDAQIDKIVYNLIEKNIVSRIKSEYTKILDNIIYDLKSDIYKDNAVLISKVSKKPISKVLKTKEVVNDKTNGVNAIQTRIKYLTKLYNDTSITYKINEINNERKLLTLIIKGNSPSKLKLSNNLNHNIFYKNNLLKSGILLYSDRKIVENSQNIFSTILYGTKTVQNKEMKYQFIVDKNISSKDIISNIKFTNFITGEEIKAKKLVADINLETIKTGTIKFKKQKTKILQGTIKVSKTLVFDKHTTVNIESGTTFIMDENTSIYFYGKVTAKGTKEKPIKFIAKDPKKPWGLVAVQGQATSGSKFEYCHFENGSVDTRNLIHYTSPFNIHDTKDFEVRNCFIGRNFKGDDAMHIAYANGIVDSCIFDGARSDGLDIDIADVTVSNSIFANSGNDGLDVMTTKMNAFNNIFIDTGDKGISVGEWSEANITNSFFLRTVIGTEIKDKSKVKADNLIFVDSKEKAINLYNKNKRYDTGGFLNANKIYLLGNTKVTADKRSEFDIKEPIKGNIPKLKNTTWYKNIEDTKYKNLVDDSEVKHAK